MVDEEMPRCIVSDPAQPHNLSRRLDNKVKRKTKKKVKRDCFACGKSKVFWEKIEGASRYYCTVCDLAFHASCVQYPSKMIHPYHPQHPLTFTFKNSETGTISATNYDDFVRAQNGYDFKMPECLEIVGPKSIIFDRCTWCGENLGMWFYRCSICNFSLNIDCAKNSPPLTIKNPKSHHHLLTLFPQPPSFPCDACGLIKVSDPSYACYQCNYTLHKSCIDLPRVIKITRHPHRLSHTPYTPAKVSACRVCYKNVDIKYGQYSCNHDDCSYVIHSRCATHEKIWDGRELEWESEESKEVEDIAPFKKVGGDLIEHFFHSHHFLKLEKYDGIRGSEKKCDACIRPIRSHDFYSCIECEYFLHEVCANLPKKLDHALHNHPLFIDTSPLCNRDYLELNCSACLRLCTGLFYKCRESGCNDSNVEEPFQLDISCILVPECFTHESHAEHPLFISLSYSEDDVVDCQGCQRRFRGYHLHCTLCKFAICYTCATIPNKLYYKFDEHPLSLCYGESGVDGMYWCEVCEERLDPTEWFYTNNESCVTIHRKCLFGETACMKAGHTFLLFFHVKVELVSNGSNSRPMCDVECHNHHCQNPVYFKLWETDGTVMVICCI